jgi:hypothetical protein
MPTISQAFRKPSLFPTSCTTKKTFLDTAEKSENDWRRLQMPNHLCGGEESQAV